MRKVLYILGELTDQDVDWLMAHGRKVQVPKGATLIQVKQAADTVYIVLEGRLRVSLPGNDALTLAKLGAGEIVGEMSFVDDRPPSANVTATEPSVVLSIPHADLEAKLGADAGFASRFYRALAVFLSDRLRSTMVQLGAREGGPTAEELNEATELNSNVLASLHMAGGRFDRMLKRLLGS
jgi:bacteriocin-type transport-associated protein